VLYFLSSSSPSESLNASNQEAQKKKKRKNKKKKNKHGPLFIMLGVLMMLENQPTQVVSPNSLADFVRVTTFLRISLVFPRY